MWHEEWMRFVSVNWSPAFCPDIIFTFMTQYVRLCISALTVTSTTATAAAATTYYYYCCYYYCYCCCAAAAAAAATASTTAAVAAAATTTTNREFIERFQSLKGLYNLIREKHGTRKYPHANQWYIL